MLLLRGLRMLTFKHYWTQVEQFEVMGIRADDSNFQRPSIKNVNRSVS